MKERRERKSHASISIDHALLRSWFFSNPTHDFEFPTVNVLLINCIKSGVDPCSSIHTNVPHLLQLQDGSGPFFIAAAKAFAAITPCFACIQLSESYLGDTVLSCQFSHHQLFRYSHTTLMASKRAWLRGDLRVTDLTALQLCNFSGNANSQSHFFLIAKIECVALWGKEGRVQLKKITRSLGPDHATEVLETDHTFIGR